jgi:NADPH-ferrihemoprotein reductase
MFSVCLGGNRLVPVGLGDDDQCIEDDFNAWYTFSIYFQDVFSYVFFLLHCHLHCFINSCALRKESLWPELDRLLRDENDVSTGTTYTAAIPEYRIEFVKPEEASLLDRNFSLTNGHAVHDAQHPCR